MGTATGLRDSSLARLADTKYTYFKPYMFTRTGAKMHTEVVEKKRNAYWHSCRRPKFCLESMTLPIYICTLTTELTTEELVSRSN